MRLFVKKRLLSMLLCSAVSFFGYADGVLAQSTTLRGSFESNDKTTKTKTSRYSKDQATNRVAGGAQHKSNNSGMPVASSTQTDTAFATPISRFTAPVPQARRMDEQTEVLTGSITPRVERMPSTRAMPNDLKSEDPHRLVRRVRRVEDDPFAPVGIRYGNMTYLPSLEMAVGFDSNYQRFKGGDSAGFAEVLPALKMQSDWSRHDLNADFTLGYRRYFVNDDANRPNLNGQINSRFDAMKDLRLLGGVKGAVLENTSNADMPAAAAERPLSYTYGANVGVEKQFNRATFTLRGLVDRSDFENVALTNGTTFSNADRNFTSYGLRMRAAYEAKPGLMPFVEGQWDTREHDRVADRNGLRRDSVGYGARVGSTYEITRLVQLEASVGYAQRDYDDVLLPKLKGPSVDFAVNWTPTNLTQVKLRGSTMLDETTLNNSSGSVARSVGVEVKHALRRYLQLTSSVDYTHSDYQGLARTDQSLRGLVRADYKLTRAMALFGAYRFEYVFSNIAGQDYASHILMSGVKFTR